MHGVALGGGQLADVVGGQGKRVALPLGGQGLAVGRELAANPVGVGNKEGRAKPVTQIAVRVVVHVQHFLGFVQVGGHEHVDVALAGEVGGDLQDLHAATGQDGDAGELRLAGAHGFAGEGDDFLAADLGDIRDSVGAGGLARHQNRQSEREQGKYANNCFHFDPSLEMQSDFSGISLERAGFATPESVFRRRCYFTPSGGQSA